MHAPLSTRVEVSADISPTNKDTTPLVTLPWGLLDLCNTREQRAIVRMK